jgi:hypothetical protein
MKQLHPDDPVSYLSQRTTLRELVRSGKGRAMKKWTWGMHRGLHLRFYVSTGTHAWEVPASTYVTLRRIS